MTNVGLSVNRSGRAPSHIRYVPSLRIRSVRTGASGSGSAARVMIGYGLPSRFSAAISAPGVMARTLIVAAVMATTSYAI